MDNIEEYIEAHISPEPELLSQVRRNTYLHHVYPRMCSGHLQGRVLAMLTRMVKPKRILELGAFTGYSTLCFAEAMDADAHIDTVEIDDEIADELASTFASSPYGDRITLHVGDALQVVPELAGEWDMVFIDANKRHYIEYYEMLLPRLSPGGFILADNTLWSDKVLDATANHDAQTRAIMAFNDHIAADERIEVAILPLRDGLTLIHKR